MKKTFTLTHPKTKYARLVDSVRSDIKKYIKRERKKTFPEGFDAWDFDCKFGATAEEATVIALADIGKAIDTAEAEKLTSFYVEILAKPGLRPEKPVIERQQTVDEES